MTRGLFRVTLKNEDDSVKMICFHRYSLCLEIQKMKEDHNMRNLPSASEMEHITSKEFREKMDDVLERISKENIALIIDHEFYILCPARWFELPELKQLEGMGENAVRYVAEVDDSDLSETF